MSLNDRIEILGVIFAATLLSALVVGITIFHIKTYNDSLDLPITQQWLDEETRCFYQEARVVNCETVRVE